MKKEKFNYYNIKERQHWYQQSYTDWAYHNAFTYIFGHPEMSSLEAAEEYVMKMNDAALEAKTEDTKMIFSIAYDVGISIIDDLILDERKEEFRRL